MLDAKIIHESLDPKLITALFKNFTNQYVALFELLDNAVDDRMPDKELTVSLDYDLEEAKLDIKNFTRRGMTLEDLEKFFSWGHSEKATGRIGRYGQGGKAALGYLAKSFNIKTHSQNSDLGYYVKVDDWENRQTGFTEGFEITTYKSHRDDGDVSFEIFNLKRGFRVFTIIERIKKVYRPLITQNKVEFIIDGGKSIKCEPIRYDEKTLKRFTKEIKLNNSSYILNGEYGIVPDTNSERGGFKIYQYGRNVAEKEYFKHTDPSKRWNVERLYGELYIDFDLPLSMNKTEIDKDTDLWRLIEDAMHKEIEEIIKEAIDYKTPTKKETKIIDSINKRIKKSGHANLKEVGFTNYGARTLFRDDELDGKDLIKINREHKAYKIWSKTRTGEQYYTAMITALRECTKDLPRKEAAKLINDFSECIARISSQLLE